MTGRQAADPSTMTVLIPHLFPYNAEDMSAYWKGYDWATALNEGSSYAGQPEFVGTVDDIEWIYTKAFLTVNHEVAPASEALGQSCNDCHNNPERISPQDWIDLGHDGDPLGG